LFHTKYLGRDTYIYIYIYYDIDGNNIDKCVHDPMVVKDFKCQNDSFRLASGNVGPKSLDLNKLSIYVVSFSMLVVGDWETISTPCWM
jgi:hypothetical protein